MAATIQMHTGRVPATVIAVTTFATGPRKGLPRAVEVQQDVWTADGAEYVFTRDPDGRRERFSLSLRGRNAGRWLEQGGHGMGHWLILGRREYWRSPLLPITSPVE